jgi:hypothetical protein
MKTLALLSSGVGSGREGREGCAKGAKGIQKNAATGVFKKLVFLLQESCGHSVFRVSLFLLLRSSRDLCALRVRQPALALSASHLIGAYQ